MIERIRGAGSILLLAGTFATATACTTSSGVTGYNAIAQARYALFDAEASEAERFAPDEVAEARSRLEAAEDAVRQSKPVHAARLARESAATARLATAIAQLEQAKLAAVEAAKVERDAGRLKAVTDSVVEEQR